uniref:Triple gene block protein 1 n=1 Tax=Melon yellowing-associated virus TaxID=255255 RepID=D1MYB1_9VIRU|nr:triple gene block protein 1 [Melon yellowing-associated virus]
MDVLISKLNSKFSLVNSNTKPLVINCVPGTGKSTFIRELITGRFSLRGLYCRRARFQNLTGRYIKPFKGEVEEDKFCLLDEYQVADSGSFWKFVAIFGDPQQNFLTKSFPASYICNLSHRFGSETAEYLRKSGIDVHANKSDKLSIEHIFSGKLIGTILAFERPVIKLLNSHNCQFKRPEEVRGCTFDKVSFVTVGSGYKECEKHLAYICVTRHTEELKILSANVPNTTCRLF